MPTYEYRCDNEQCEHEWEEVGKIVDPPTTACPECQEDTAKRMITATSFVIVGGGWGNSGYS